MAGLFQYQQKAEPFAATIPPPAPELSWLPHFPDTVQHRPPQTSPTLFFPQALISTSPLRLSQLPAETVTQYAAALVRTSQIPVEIVTQYALDRRQTYCSQIAVEIVYAFGCYTYTPSPTLSACVLSWPTDSAPASRDCPIDLPVN